MPLTCKVFSSINLLLLIFPKENNFSDAIIVHTRCTAECETEANEVERNMNMERELKHERAKHSAHLHSHIAYGSRKDPLFYLLEEFPDAAGRPG